MRYPRICLCAILVCLFSCVETITGQETVDLKSLADSVRKANGKPNFLPLGMHFLELAKELDKAGYQFSSANSINIGRLVPQIVYYVYAYAQLVKEGRIKAGEEINVTVPTGNFGNILAAYYAKNIFYKW